jgi:hypothetical protein
MTAMVVIFFVIVCSALFIANFHVGWLWLLWPRYRQGVYSSPLLRALLPSPHDALLPTFLKIFVCGFQDFAARCVLRTYDSETFTKPS